MDATDLQRWIEPVSGDSPSGPNMEYDAAFGELERTALFVPEKVMGDTVKPAEEPHWPTVQEQAGALLEQTKDLRVALHLTLAWLRTRGIAGLADGLSLIEQMCSSFWDDLHPQLDAEDNNDPTIRVNSLAGLTDTGSTLKFLREAPFVTSPRLGKFGLRDLRIAEGKITVPEGAPRTQITDLEGACRDSPLEALQETAAVVAAARASLKGIDSGFTDRIGSAGPDLKLLQVDLQEIDRFLQGQLAKLSPTGGGADSEGAAEGEGEAGGSGDGPRISGRIGGTQDVLRTLDLICDYYARAEPSSPVPILLNRAKRLVGKDFLAILQNLAPGGMSELMVIKGADEEAEGSSDSY